MATKKLGAGWVKPTGRLADFMNAKKGTLLLGDIQAHMMKEHSKPSTRRQDVVHPSEVAKTGWCPRSTYERIKACREASDAFLKPAESVGVQLLNIFDEGHYIHDKWQKRLRDMGDLWGNWECAACGNVTKSHMYEPNQFCDYCERHGNITIYREVPMRLDSHLISGHADGAIPRLDALIEIKSVGVGTARIEAPDIYKANSDGQKIDLQGLWRDIQEPFPAHIRQGQLYLAICDKMGLPFNKIIFLYESKFNQGAKEFVVDYDPTVAYPLLRTAEIIKDALEGLTEPPRCPSNGCKECDIYGPETPVGLGNTPEPSKLKRIARSGSSSGGSAGTSKRIVGSS